MKAVLNTRILAALAMIVFVGTVVASSTGAFFSDTETSTGNTFTAGAIDLKIDSVSHYNGMVCTAVGQSYVWIPKDSVELNEDMQPVADEDMDEQANWDAYNTANPAQYPQAGVACTGTWPAANIDENSVGIGRFFDFLDIKPGDEGENTISLHVDSNDAWMCVGLANVGGADAGGTATEPELEAGDTTFGNTVVASELDENLQFFAWLDDGDNIFEPGGAIPGSTKTETAFGAPVSASTLATQNWALADGGTGNPIQGGTTHYIGLAWCAGTMNTNGGLGPITCNGATMGNIAQTDSWNADLKFYVEQSRNNPNFRCNPQTAPVTTLTLAKAVIPPAAALDSAFTLSADGPTDLTGVEGESSVTNASVTPGVYALSETGGPENTLSRVWQCSGNTGPFVDNGNGTASVTINSGDAVTCGITNTYPEL